MRILLMCSKGGHLEEMMGLKDAWGRYEHLLLTYRSARTDVIKENKILISHPFNSIPRFCRDLLAAVFRIILYKPDVLISTGMGWTDIFVFPLCRIAGTYTVYIESAANVDYISGTAKFLRPFARRFLVQWKGLADSIGAEYHGGVF